MLSISRLPRCGFRSGFIGCHWCNRILDPSAVCMYLIASYKLPRMLAGKAFLVILPPRYFSLDFLLVLDLVAQGLTPITNC